MEATEKLIKDYSDAGHPLGHPILPKDVPGLLENLKTRLGISESVLDLTPTGLKNLEFRLVEYYRSLQKQKQSLEGESLVQFIKELAAYIGEFLKQNANGRWDENSTSLYTTFVAVEGPWEVIKDTHLTSSLPTFFSIVIEAAYCWDKITSGEKATLYKLYKIIRSRKLREG